MNNLVSIVIPTKNEKEGIAQTIQSIPRYLIAELGYQTEIIVIDSSQDETAELARKAGAIVIREERRGVGIAMKTGFLHSEGDIIVTSDGDGTYPLSYLRMLLPMFINQNLDFLTTDRLRFLNNGSMSKRNKIGNRLLSLALSLLFGVTIRDSQSGMMIIKKSVLDKMQLNSNTPVPQEMKIEACHFIKCHWAEIPIMYYPRLGKSKLTANVGGWKLGIGNMLHLLKKRIKR